MLNTITIMGRLTKDPELRKTTNGTSVATLSVAVDRDFDREKTDFFNVVAWRNTAEFVAKNFSKGRAICVHGRLKTRKWTDKNGNSRTEYEIVADSVYFADSKPSGKNEAMRTTAPQEFYEMQEEDEELPF